MLEIFFCYFSLIYSEAADLSETPAAETVVLANDVFSDGPESPTVNMPLRRTSALPLLPVAEEGLEVRQILTRPLLLCNDSLYTACHVPHVMHLRQPNAYSLVVVTLVTQPYFSGAVNRKAHPYLVPATGR